MSIAPVIEDLKTQGFEVYGPEKLTTYVWFTDGERIGYVQNDRLEGIKYSTVHKPCRECGTGFEAAGVEQALGFAPHWTTSEARAAVRKYKNFEEFKGKYWQPLARY